jgi:diadenosine tetraphosphate (Ap4A) HIT family hydrolase
VTTSPARWHELDDRVYEDLVTRYREGCVFCAPDARLVLAAGALWGVCYDVAPLAPGHLILFSTEHYSCAGAVPDEERDQLRQLADEAKAMVRDRFGAASLYEHGRAGHCLADGPEHRLCHHCHVHCVPGDHDLTAELEEQFERLPVTDYRQLGELYDLYGDYLYLETDDGRASFFVVQEEIERHLMRTLVARRLDCPERADWRAHRGADLLRESLAALPPEAALRLRQHTGPRGASADATGSSDPPTCAFCLSPGGSAGGLTADQSVLLRGRYHYVMAPLGHLMEGFLLIMPSTCVTDDGRRRRCVAQLEDDELVELRQLMDLVSEFYASAYGVTEVTCYEQGRAGGGLDSDHSGRFYHHAHVCCVPAWVELRPDQEAIHQRIDVAGIADVAAASARRPYLYLELRRDGQREAAVFVGRDDEGARALENARLRTLVAAYLGIPQRGNWRQGDDLVERDAVVHAFTRFWKEHAAQFRRMSWLPGRTASRRPVEDAGDVAEAEHPGGRRDRLRRR